MHRTILTAVFSGLALAMTAGLGAQSSNPTPITIVPIQPISPSSSTPAPAVPSPAPSPVTSPPLPCANPPCVAVPPSVTPIFTPVQPNVPAVTPSGCAAMPCAPAAPSAMPATSAPAIPVAPTERVLQLTFNPDGTVSLVAKGVAARDVLAEWKRKCACAVINAEKLVGGPLPIPVQFDNAPQRTVLDALLRQAAGYTLTPRRAGTVSVSNFETIYILATSSPTTSSFTSGGSPTPAPYATVGAPDDELPPIAPIAPPPQTPAGAQQRPPAAAPSPGVFVPLAPVTPSMGVPAPNRSNTPPATMPGTGRGGGGI